LKELTRDYPVTFGHFKADFLYPFSIAEQLFNRFKSISKWLSAKTWQYRSIFL
jgi:hypothetical protein